MIYSHVKYFCLKESSHLLRRNVEYFNGSQLILQGRNHGKMLAETSAIVGRICPPWLE